MNDVTRGFLSICGFFVGIALCISAKDKEWSTSLIGTLIGTLIAILSMPYFMFIYDKRTVSVAPTKKGGKR
jgi:ABC-type methionine transport system permease subunit